MPSPGTIRPPPARGPPLAMTFPLASAPNSRDRWRNESPATLEKPRHSSSIPRTDALAQGAFEPAHHRCAVATTRARAGPKDRTLFFFFQAEDGIRDVAVTGVQTCALPI